MKKSLFIIVVFVSCFTVLSNAQPTSETNTKQVVEKASYSGDLEKALWHNLNYPQEAFMNKIQGDVILSFVIKVNGKIDDINLISTPSEMLSTSSINSLNGLNSEWNPYKVNGVAIDKTYLLVYRYRVLSNSSHLAYEKKAEKFIKKEKFDKALKIYDNLIEDNKFNFSLFEKRAKTNELLGNVENANKDMEQALKLKNGVISTIDVNVISYKSAPRYLGTTVVREEF